MTPVERIISKGQLVPLVFMQDAAAANQSAVAMKVAEVASAANIGVDEVCMPWDFDIVGVSLSSDAAVTTGSALADPTIGGTATGLQATIDTTSTLRDTATQPRKTDKGVAGSYVGCKLTTSSDFAPATADVVAVVWVLLYVDTL
jgi:hypothetical protein